jgi:predicted HicB family RNase H-like nuclease
MAKKKAAKMPQTTEPKTKPVRLDLPPDVHRMLRIAAAEDDVSMASLARDVVAEYLRARMKKRSGKG